jgi:hypothetical protein
MPVLAFLSKEQPTGIDSIQNSRRFIEDWFILILGFLHHAPTILTGITSSSVFNCAVTVLKGYFRLIATTYEIMGPNEECLVTLFKNIIGPWPLSRIVCCVAHLAAP